MELVEDVHKLAVLRANAIGDYLVSLPPSRPSAPPIPRPSWCYWGPTGTPASWLAGRARSTAACLCRQPSGWATIGRQLRPRPEERRAADVPAVFVLHFLGDLVDLRLVEDHLRHFSNHAHLLSGCGT